MGSTIDSQDADTERIGEESMAFAGIGLCRCRLDGTVLSMDAQASAIFDLDDPSEATGRRLQDLRVVVPYREDLRQQLLEHGQARDVECEVKTHRGTSKWLLLDAYLVPSSGGAPESIQGVIRDITARKRREEQCRLLALAVEQATEGIAVINLDGCLLFLNNTFAAMHGYTTDELIGRHIEIFHAPEQMPAVDAANRQTKATGEFKGDIWHIRRDGSTFPAAMHNSLLRDENGRAVGMIGTASDMTEQKWAEEERRVEAQRYRVLAEELPLGVSIIDKDGRYRYLNPSFIRMLGYTLEDIPTGRHWFARAFPDPARRAQVVTAWVDRLKSRSHGEVRPGTYPVVCKDGSQKLIKFRPVTLISGDQFVFYEDITEIKRAAEERQRLQEHMQQTQKLESLVALAGGVAHDFNNLLTGVLGNAQLAMDDGALSSTVRECIEDIVISAKRASDLSRQMLAYSGKGRFAIERVDLNAVVKEILHLLRVATAKKAAIQCDLAENLPRIEVDATQVRQVIMNLITNAAEAHGLGVGAITVTTGLVEPPCGDLTASYLDSEEACVYLEVGDTGCGMDDETKAKIFDPFFTTKFTGRGLGMSVVLGIMRGHRGAIQIDSKPGRGTTVRVLFPLRASLDRQQELPD